MKKESHLRNASLLDESEMKEIKGGLPSDDTCKGSCGGQPCRNAAVKSGWCGPYPPPYKVCGCQTQIYTKE